MLLLFYFSSSIIIIIIIIITVVITIIVVVSASVFVIFRFLEQKNIVWRIAQLFLRENKFKIKISPPKLQLQMTDGFYSQLRL